MNPLLLLPALGKLPWRLIFILGLCAGGLYSIYKIGFGVYNYIQQAEADRVAVVALKEANIGLQSEMSKAIKAIEESIKKEREREKAYADNIKAIQSLEDSGCARSSLPIIESLRLRRNRENRD